MCLRLPVVFRPPPFASWPSCPATDIRFPCGRPTGGRSAPPDLGGVSMFRTGETRPVSGAPCTPGPWCSHGRRRDFGHHCRLPAAGPVPRCCTHLPRLCLTRLTRVHHIRPSGLSLACGQWMEHRPLGFLPGFTPRRYQRRMPGAGTSVEHSLGANRRSFSTLHIGYLTHSVRPHVARRVAPAALLRPGPPQNRACHSSRHTAQAARVGGEASASTGRCRAAGRLGDVGRSGRVRGGVSSGCCRVR